ncbi:hypothetical protein [Paludisphaera sp.]|uniref:hypothetical protein n=1 Tax=Paludisphaera sp. TaxID=2017432 RepID=UPI00301B99C2
MGQGKDQVDASPSEIREEIAKTRSDLRRHLGALNPRNLLGLGESPADTKMPTTKKTASKKAAKAPAKKAEPKDDAKKLDAKAKPG